MEATVTPDWKTRWGLDSRLLFWLVLCAAGFAWVAMVQCGRPGPFLDRRGGYEQFTRLMLFAPLLYVLGPRCVLTAFGSPGAWRDNLLGYALPFFVGLQFFYLQRIDAINFSLTADDFARMGPVAIAVFGGLGLLIVALLGLHAWWAHRAGILLPYVLCGIGSVLFIALVTYLVRDTRHLHIHHWFVGIYFVPFTRFPNPLSRGVQAVCAAIGVEGIAEWSMATLWELN